MTSPTSGAYTPAPARGDCPSGKVQFATRKQAKATRKWRRLDGLAVYRCDCGWFHLGHLPERVRRGEVDKSAWLDAIERRGNA